MSGQITFGTSGHRGIIGETFTVDDVIAIAHAVADYLLIETPKPKIIIGYDPRNGNDPKMAPGSFTEALCRTLSKRGIHVLFSSTYTATPVISWAITHYNLDGGLILTASHNPPEYNGIKFNPKNGAPAPVSITEKLQRKARLYIQNMPQNLFQDPPAPIENIDPTPAFAEHMKQSLTALLNGAIPLSTAVAIDAKHGTAAHCWTALFQSFNITEHTIVHTEARSDFGHINPNPTKLNTLDKLRKAQQDLQAPIAIANDPDCDRHIILDENGHALSPEETCVIILDYLLQKGVRISGIASTLASSALVKSACKSHTINYHETEVGFKYFAPILEAAKNNEEIVLAVESSGGFSTSFHTFEKCGFLPGIILMMCVSETGKTLSEWVQICRKTYGHFHFVEDEYQFTVQEKEEIKHFLSVAKTDEFASVFSSETVASLDKRDGLKINFESGDWALLRLSGTEPLARIYAESTHPDRATAYVKALKNKLETI